MKVIAAKALRSPSQLGLIPKDKPGWYRWWAPTEALYLLLQQHYDELLPLMTKGQQSLKGLYYVYVGVAIKESIQARLNWHVNQKHNQSCVKHGTLSTLRQSIASLAGSSQGDEKGTNRVIDLLTIEYDAVDMPLRSPATRQHIDQIEGHEIEQNMLPLNIRQNKHPALKQYKKELSASRKAAKQRYLKTT